MCGWHPARARARPPSSFPFRSTCRALWKCFWPPSTVRSDVHSPLPITVAVVTLNEEQNLARCLESVRGLVSEIVVLDCGSTDKTEGVAQKFGATFKFAPWTGYVSQK